MLLCTLDCFSTDFVLFRKSVLLCTFGRAEGLRLQTASNERPLWDTAPDPNLSNLSNLTPDMVPEPALGPSLPHAPGARMTVVKLTPSNYVCEEGGARRF